jgi:hypothetical protein
VKLTLERKKKNSKNFPIYMSKIRKISPEKNNTEFKQPSVPGGDPWFLKILKEPADFMKDPAKNQQFRPSSWIGSFKLLEPPGRLKTGSMTFENRHSRVRTDSLTI